MVNSRALSAEACVCMCVWSVDMTTCYSRCELSVSCSLQLREEFRSSNRPHIPHSPLFSTQPQSTTSNLIDCEGADTYPIAGYTYFIVRMEQRGNCSSALELARYIDWFMSNAAADRELERHLMVPVSRSLLPLPILRGGCRRHRNDARARTVLRPQYGSNAQIS